MLLAITAFVFLLAGFVKGIVGPGRRRAGIFRCAP